MTPTNQLADPGWTASHQQLGSSRILSMASLSSALHRHAGAAVQQSPDQGFTQLAHGRVQQTPVMATAGCLLSATAATWGHREYISTVHSEAGRQD